MYVQVQPPAVLYDLEQPESQSPTEAETRSRRIISIDMDRVPDAYLSSGIIRRISHEQYLIASAVI